MKQDYSCSLNSFPKVFGVRQSTLGLWIHTVGLTPIEWGNPVVNTTSLQAAKMIGTAVTDDDRSSFFHSPNSLKATLAP
jgi:hypothetical protein